MLQKLNKIINSLNGIALLIINIKMNMTNEINDYQFCVLLVLTLIFVKIIETKG